MGFDGKNIQRLWILTSHTAKHRYVEPLASINSLCFRTCQIVSDLPSAPDLAFSVLILEIQKFQHTQELGIVTDPLSSAKTN